MYNKNTKNRMVGATLTTSNVDIYTVPARYTSYVTSIIISNQTASSATVSLDWYDYASSTYYTLMEQVSIAGNSIIQISDEPLTLQQADKLRALASANSAITITIKVEEEFYTANNR